MPAELQAPDPHARLARLIERQSQKRHLAAIWAKAAGIAPGMAILDIGAGSGVLALEYAALVGPTGLVIALDPDAACLDHIGVEANRRVLPVRTVQGSAATLPPLPAIPDRIMLTDALHHMADPIPALRALHAILPPHGLLFIAEYDPDQPGRVGAKRSRRTPRADLIVMLQSANFRPGPVTDAPDEHYTISATA